MPVFKNLLRAWTINCYPVISTLPSFYWLIPFVSPIGTQASDLSVASSVSNSPNIGEQTTNDDDQVSIDSSFKYAMLTVALAAGIIAGMAAVLIGFYCRRVRNQNQQAVTPVLRNQQVLIQEDVNGYLMPRVSRRQEATVGPLIDLDDGNVPAYYITPPPESASNYTVTMPLCLSSASVSVATLHEFPHEPTDEYVESIDY